MLDPMNRPSSGPSPPAELLEAAEARAEARRQHDWPTADRLRAQIESAGWKVIDRGTRFRLEIASSPDLEDEGITRYGSSDSVPSRLNELPSVDVSWILELRRDAEAFPRLPQPSPADPPAMSGQLVAVANGVPADDSTLPDARAFGWSRELVSTSAPLSPGSVWNIGVRRSAGRLICLAGASVSAGLVQLPTGSQLTSLVQAFDDPTVGVVGAPGLRSADMRHFQPVEAGAAQAIGRGLLCFRRDEFLARGPLDEGFNGEGWLHIWWSLVLRDQKEGVPPRRALAVNLGAWPDAALVGERSRPERRDFYRFLERFGDRRDLLTGSPGVAYESA